MKRLDTFRAFEPLTADHPLIGESCPGCKRQFAVGDRVALIVIGPGDNEEAQSAAREGRPYNAVSMPAHWKCVTGEDL